MAMATEWQPLHVKNAWKVYKRKRLNCNNFYGISFSFVFLLVVDRNFHMYVQSRFSDFKFSDNLWFSDYFSKDHFSICYKKSFDLVTLCDLVTIFEETKSVTKSRLQCTSIQHSTFFDICTYLSCSMILWSLYFETFYDLPTYFYR